MVWVCDQKDMTDSLGISCASENNSVPPSSVEIASRPSFPAYLFLFLPPLFWSSNFILGRALVDRVSPWTLNTGRFVVAAVILIPLLLYRQGWPAVLRKFIVPLVLMSLTGVFAFNAVLYTGLHYTTAINATLVYNTIPFFVIILSAIFLGERLMLYQGVGGAVIIAGVVIGTSDRVS